MTNPQPLCRQRLHKVTLRHIKPLHIQKIQQLHHQYLLHTVRVLSIHLREALYLLQLRLNGLVLVLEMDFAQFVFVLERLEGLVGMMEGRKELGGRVDGRKGAVL